MLNFEKYWELCSFRNLPRVSQSYTDSFFSKKTYCMYIRILFVISLITLMVACSPIITSSTKSSNTILHYKMQEVFSAWDKNPMHYDYNFLENNHTYIQTGLRYNYAILKDLASIAMLEKIVGDKIFVSGPHSEFLNFQSSNSFGYYNPAFWEKVETVLEYSLKKDGTFRQLGKYVYDKHLKKMSDLYYDSYMYLKENEATTNQVVRDYQTAMKNGVEAGRFIQDSFRDYADTKEQLGADWYIANTAPGFWIRRQIDGTAEQIFELLELVRATYEK